MKSAPCGTGAPVKMRTASPEWSSASYPRPAALSPTMVSATASPMSARRTAQPSMAEESNGGWSRTAVTVSASVRPSALDRVTVSAAKAETRASILCLASSTLRPFSLRIGSADEGAFEDIVARLRVGALDQAMRLDQRAHVLDEVHAAAEHDPVFLGVERLAL